MQFFAKKCLISFCLIVSMLANGIAQERKYSFTWLDESERKMAGSIVVNLLPLQGDGQYELNFTVVWNDQDGKPITANVQKPFLCLSEWYLDIMPLQQIRCTSIDQKKPFTLFFQTAEKLNLQVLNGYGGKVDLAARFQYALSRKLYETGKSEMLDIMGSNTLKMSFQVEAHNKTNEITIGADTKKVMIEDSKKAEAMHSLAEDYKKLQSEVKALANDKSIEELSRPDYRQKLDNLSAGIIKARAMLNPDSLPADSFQVYRERYNRLNDSVFDLRTDHMNFQIRQTDLSSGSDFAKHLRKNDSLRNLIRIRMEPVVHGQVDSLTLLAQDQKLVAKEIGTSFSDVKVSSLDRRRIDSLILRHSSIKVIFLNLKQAHGNAWNNYRIDIDTLLPLKEIENLHATFLRGQIDLQTAIDLVDSELSALLPGKPETPWYMSNRLLWTGLLAVLFLVFASAIWSTSRNRKILKERLSFLDRENSGSLPGKTLVPGILSNEGPKEYFTINFDDTLSESVVGQLHFHTSSIKSVYQFVQSALLERRGGDFGGYLFGNQYKLHGTGTAGNELFIEKACDSKYLRSSIANSTGARADLIDELDELVRENKKYRLVGWYTSSADSSMEIPEGLMKIHRSFFKEKWQIGILLNPGSDVLQGACFLRRKSGYLDPMPDPAAFVKWDELYRFALNPSNGSKNSGNGSAKKGKDYSRIALNNTWGDSVITAVNFDLPVVDEITAAAALQAIPRDTFQVVGYLYGTAESRLAADGKKMEYEVFVNRFIELSNELTPRDLPGVLLLGWWGQANVDVMIYLQNAIDYHEQTFREAYQISCLVNPSTGELRIFTRKHSLEMNNSTIETEEYSLKSLLSR